MSSADTAQQGLGLAKLKRLFSVANTGKVNSSWTTCGYTRTFYANWSTHITAVKPLT